MNREIISNTSPISSSFCTPSPEETKEEDLLRETNAYNALLQDGGQPSHPVFVGFDDLDGLKEYADILWYWRFFGGDRMLFRNQLGDWKEFREYQSKIRKRHGNHTTTRDRFSQYRRIVRESAQDMEPSWVTTICKDLRRQNRLDNWNEYRAYHYQKLKNFQRLIEHATETLHVKEQRLRAAESSLSNALANEDVLGAQDVMTSERRRRDVGEGVEMAKSRSTRAESNDMTIEVKRTCRQLRSAINDHHNATETDAKQRVRKAYELEGLREGVTFAHARLGGFEIDVQRWKTLLRWIDQQYPTVAADCASPFQGTHHSDLTRLYHRESRKRYSLRSGSECYLLGVTRPEAEPLRLVRSRHSSSITKSKSNRRLQRGCTSISYDEGQFELGGNHGEILEESCPSHALKDNTSSHLPAQVQRRSERLSNLRSVKQQVASTKDVLGPKHTFRISKTRAGKDSQTAIKQTTPTDFQTRNPRISGNSTLEASRIQQKPKTVSSLNNLRRSKRVLSRSSNLHQRTIGQLA